MKIAEHRMRCVHSKLYNTGPAFIVQDFNGIFSAIFWCDVLSIMHIQ